MLVGLFVGLWIAWIESGLGVLLCWLVVGSLAFCFDLSGLVCASCLSPRNEQNKTWLP